MSSAPASRGTIRVKAHAKLNIGLKVTGVRSDGYHELVSVMVPVSLHDELELTLTKAGISLECSGYAVPTGRDNLAYRAAEVFLARIGGGNGAHIRLKKTIPTAAGLGGGSSDAASVLLSLNALLGGILPYDDLRGLALSLGADVPFFLLARPAIATGIGEVLRPLSSWPKIWYVIVCPPVQVSTSWAYSNLKISLTSHDLTHKISDFEATPFEVARLLGNDLETVTAARYPVINRIKEILVDAGAEGALMSGSGPSVYGMFKTDRKAAEAWELMKRLEMGEVFLVQGVP